MCAVPSACRPIFFVLPDRFGLAIRARIQCSRSDNFGQGQIIMANFSPQNPWLVLSLTLTTVRAKKKRKKKVLHTCKEAKGSHFPTEHSGSDQRERYRNRSRHGAHQSTTTTISSSSARLQEEVAVDREQGHRLFLRWMQCI